MAGHRIARRLRLVAPTSVWIGIDLGQERHAVAVLSPDGRLLARFWMANALSGFQQLVERARGFSGVCSGAPVVIGMEATNHYWETLVDFLDEHGLAWRLINPFTAKRHREGADLARTKHDRRDAMQLAEMLRIGYFTETKRLPPAYAALRRAFHEHVRLADARAQQQILIRHALEGVFPELRRACRAGVQSEAVRSVLRTGLTPRQIAALSEAEFVERVRAHFHGKRLFCCKLRALYAACRETVGSTLGSEAAMAEIRRCLATFDHLEVQLAEVDAELDVALVLIPISRHLFTMPGLGRITVAGLLAEIGPIEWYTSGK
jgi:transposase